MRTLRPRKRLNASCAIGTDGSSKAAGVTTPVSPALQMRCTALNSPRAPATRATAEPSSLSPTGQPRSLPSKNDRSGLRRSAHLRLVSVTTRPPQGAAKSSPQSAASSTLSGEIPRDSATAPIFGCDSAARGGQLIRSCALVIRWLSCALDPPKRIGAALRLNRVLTSL